MFEETRVRIYLLTSLLGALAGVAYLLKSDAKITVRSVSAAFLNSGLCGLGVTMIGITALPDSYSQYVPGFVGLSVIAGLGGMRTVEYVGSGGQALIGALFDLIKRVANARSTAGAADKGDHQ